MHIVVELHHGVLRLPENSVYLSGLRRDVTPSVNFHSALLLTANQLT